MPIVGERNGRERHAVRGVGVSADGLSEHVDFPIRRFALRNERVQCPRRRPHDVGPRLVIGMVLDRNARIDDERSHQRLRKIIAHVVVRAGEILFADVVEGIVNTRHHLPHGNAVSEGGVENGELGHGLTAEHMADLQLLGMVGDDRAAVHLTARADHRQHTPDGQDLAIGFLKAQVVLVPRVLIAKHGDGYGLGVIAYRTAADGEEQVYMMFACDVHAFIEFFGGGVGHDAAVLDDGLAAIFQNFGYGVIDAVFLDGPAAIDELDGMVRFEFGREVCERALAEVEFGGIVKGEISEHDGPPFGESIAHGGKVVNRSARLAALYEATFYIIRNRSADSRAVIL